jgi:tRNA nucleotidyltransferase (CCA-adding enzyme)
LSINEYKNKIKISESVVNNTQYKSALNNKIFEVISQASQELNVDSYVIGGFVRDLILNRDFKKTSTLLPLAAD